MEELSASTTVDDFSRNIDDSNNDYAHEFRMIKATNESLKKEVRILNAAVSQLKKCYSTSDTSLDSLENFDEKDEDLKKKLFAVHLDLIHQQSEQIKNDRCFKMEIMNLRHENRRHVDYSKFLRSELKHLKSELKQFNEKLETVGRSYLGVDLAANFKSLREEEKRSNFGNRDESHKESRNLKNETCDSTKGRYKMATEVLPREMSGKIQTVRKNEQVIQSLKNEIKYLESELSQKNADIRRDEDLIDQLTEENKQFQMKLIEKENTFNESDEILEEVTEERDKLLVENAQLKKQLEEIQIHQKILEDEVGKLKSC